VDDRGSLLLVSGRPRGDLGGRTIVETRRFGGAVSPVVCALFLGQSPPLVGDRDSRVELPYKDVLEEIAGYRLLEEVSSPGGDTVLALEGEREGGREGGRVRQLPSPYRGCPPLLPRPVGTDSALHRAAAGHCFLSSLSLRLIRGLGDQG